MVEVARARVMDRVRVSPGRVRRQREHAEQPADPIVGGALAEEGAVAAIVLDHEEPHEKSGGWQRKDEAGPVTKS